MKTLAEERAASMTAAEVTEALGMTWRRDADAMAGLGAIVVSEGGVAVWEGRALDVWGWLRETGRLV